MVRHDVWLTADDFLIEATFEQIFPHPLFYDRPSSKEGLSRSFSLSFLCVSHPFSVCLLPPYQTQHVSWSLKCLQEFGQHLSTDKAICFLFFSFIFKNIQFNTFLCFIWLLNLSRHGQNILQLCVHFKRKIVILLSFSLPVCLFFV